MQRLCRHQALPPPKSRPQLSPVHAMVPVQLPFNLRVEAHKSICKQRPALNQLAAYCGEQNSLSLFIALDYCVEKCQYQN